MSVVLEYNPLAGWQAPDKVNLSIIQLNHKMRGASLPLPSSVIRALLGLYLPGVLTSALISALPAELGAYVQASGEPVRASGELRVLGQQLATHVAGMAPPPSTASSGGKAGGAETTAAARARALLNLSEGQAAALAELWGGRHSLLDKARPLSLCELCRFYVRYSRSKLWGHLCAVWDRALQVSRRLGGEDKAGFAPCLAECVVSDVTGPMGACSSLDVRTRSVCPRVAHSFGPPQPCPGNPALLLHPSQSVSMCPLALCHRLAVAVLL